jgi:hypothetical protein
MFIRALLIIVALLWALPAAAQVETHYVRDGASCTNNCHSWTNAYDELTTLLSAGDLSRGDTIYVADGSYAGINFTVANSGTTRIIIQKCTAADHGTETGYNANDCNGQAVFGSFWWQSGYLTVDGMTGGGPDDWDCTLCGFRFNGESVMGQGCCSDPSSDPPDGNILRHAQLDGENDDSGDAGRTLELRFTSDLLIEYAYIHDAKCDLMEATGLTDVTIQYSQLARPHQIICHGDLLEHQISASSNIVIRWNYFEDIVGSYAFGSHGPDINGYQIYGNIFYWPTVSPVFGNHLVGTIDGQGADISNLKFYNNSLYGPFFDDGDSTTNVCIGNLGTGTSNEVRNNIWVSTHGVSAEEYDCGVGGATATANTGYQINGLTEELTGNPFTSVVGGDFSLTGASSAGTDTGATVAGNDADMLGCARGDDGNWDRGAIEFDATSCAQVGGEESAPGSPLNRIGIRLAAELLFPSVIGMWLSRFHWTL